MSNPFPSKLPVATNLLAFDVEQLEKRTLLSAASVYNVDNIPAFTATSSDLRDVQNGPFTKGGANLAGLYTSYQKWRSADALDSHGKPVPFTSDLFYVKNGIVAVTIRSRVNLTNLVNEIRPLGIQLINKDAKNALVDVFIPIAQLHTLVAMPHVASVMGIYKPSLNAEGSVDNQANQAMDADKARAVFGVDGTGVKVGVLSDSVDSAGGGLADSQSTGDLGHVEIVSADDDPFGSFGGFGTDEGRAMLELIHDIAPGAQLYFATADGGIQTMADNILALQEAGCNVIVDDVTYFAESMFQEGIIAEAIGTVRSLGVTYLSSAGNGGVGGYQRDIQWDDQPDGTSLVDFRPGNGVDSRMNVTVEKGGTFSFQWDNPWNGLVGNVTANLDISFRDPASGKVVVQGNDDNFFTGAPIEIFNLPAGDFEMTISLTGLQDAAVRPTVFKLASGSGTIGETEYAGLRSQTFGHNSSQYAISVGAVPFFGTEPFTDDIAQKSTELYSSSGPVTSLFKGDGTRRTKPITLLKPDLSGIDGGNTSFFSLEDDSKNDTDSFPNFFGTSAAAPNVAAVAALLLSFNPNLTPDEVQATLTSSAKIHPLNNAKHNAWNQQGGYGLVDATRALQILDDAPYVNISRVTPDPRSTPVDSVSFTFSREVGGFDLADLTLKLNGQKGPNLLDGSNATLTTTDNITYVLNGLADLTTSNGDYALTLKAGGSGIIDGSGHALKPDSREMFHIVRATPAAPTSLTATPLTRSSIQLEWVDNSNGAASRFRIERGTNPDFTAGLKVINVAGGTTKVVDNNLDQNTKYYYRIRAATPNGYSAGSRTEAFTLSNGDIIVDNKAASVKGSWSTNTSGRVIFDTDYLTDGNSGKGNKSVTFTPNLPISGKYFVYSRWPSGSNRATNVPIDVNSADGLTTVIKDQKNTGKNGAWVLLGTFTFNKGTGGSVTIRNTATNGVVAADAVRFLSSAPVSDKQAEALSVAPSRKTTVAMANVFGATRIDRADDDLLTLL